jgi:hypothetical protein
MDRLTRGMILGFVAFIVIFGLSMLHVSQTTIGAALVIILIVSTIILRRIKR